MKRVILFFVIIVSCLLSGGYAQEANKAPTLKGHNHQAMMDMKRNYIKTNFEVASDREAAFWTAYDEYTEAEMRIYKEQSQLKSQANLPHRGDTTALTDEQISLLKKLSLNVYLCLDGDNAGIEASIHNGEILEKAGLNVKVVCLKDNDDPDTFILKYGK